MTLTVQQLADYRRSEPTDHANGPGKYDRAAGLAPESGLVVNPADLSKSKPTRWLWQDRIALGYLNLIVGNEGIGKSTLIAWVIARLTRGELPGDSHGKPISVGVMGDEDDWNDAWTPRLHAAGADLTKVFQLERPDGGLVNVTEDRERLGIEVKRHDLRLLYMDQLLDNLGVGTNDWAQKPVRDALRPLRSLARELEIPTLGSLHPNKRATSFRDLMAGTAAFNATSRSSLLIAEHPEDKDRRVLARGKGNLSQLPPAVEFNITSREFHAHGHDFNVPVATQFTTSDLTVEDLIGIGVDMPVPQGHSQLADACRIIENLLPRDGQWHSAAEIKQACEAEGINAKTVTRAKARLNIAHRRTAEFQGSVRWRWPSRDTLRTRENTVPTVPTVPTETTLNLLPLDTKDSRDTLDIRDSENRRPHCVPTAETDPLGGTK